MNRRQWGEKLRQYSILALIYVQGFLAGWLFTWLGVPLSWIIGPLVSTGCLSVVFGAPALSRWQRWSGQLVIAGAVGLNLTPEAMSNVVANIIPMVVTAIATIALAVALAMVLVSRRGVDRATALFASLPGGPIEMAGLADHYGGTGGVVAFSQTVRIAATVIFIPPILIAAGSPMGDIGASSADVRLWALLLSGVIALGGGLAALGLGIINPFFLGPLICVGVATMLDVPTSPVPEPVIAIGQIAIGVALGAMFDRRTVIAASHFIWPSLLIGGMLLALAFALAGVMAVMLDENFTMLVLASAPGGTPEMAVTAVAMSLDASMVAAFHIVRVVIILSLATVIFKVYRRASVALSARHTPPAPPS